tara:strand:+ start:2324 stop:2557 length:234 start_codon:yes stop_codon:yes gene_type:complete
MVNWPEGGFVMDETKPLPYSWGRNRTMIHVASVHAPGLWAYLPGLYACVWNDDGEVERMHFSPDGGTWIEIKGYEYA